MRKAIFLDRDNTLIRDEGYFHDPEKVEFFPGVVEGLRELQSAGFLLIVVSNQSGISRGIFKESDAIAVHEKMNELLGCHNVKIQGFYYCPHVPDENCECRKPKPFLVFKGANEFKVDIPKSFFIGNDIKDMETGRAAGAKTVLISPPELTGSADLYAQDMKIAAKLIVNYGRGEQKNASE